jgi:hypothetical protein
VTPPVALIIPAYRAMYPHMVRRLLEEVHGMDVEIAITDAAYTTAALGLALHDLKPKEWDRVVIWETDIIPPRGALRKSACYAQDIVVGLYPFRKEPFLPSVAYARPNDEYNCDPCSWEELLPGIQPCQWGGLGWMSISRRVIDGWDDKPMFARIDPPHGDVGHDAFFCLRAAEQGFGVYADTDMKCGHIGDLELHPDQFHPGFVKSPAGE